MAGIIFPIVAIVAGIMAASAVVIKKLPNAAEHIEKIKPYEAFIGVGALVMGLMQILELGKLFRSFEGMVIIVAAGACIVMGFLLGFPVLQDLFLNDMGEETRAKADGVYEKLTPYKVMAGLVAMGTGFYTLIF